MIKILHVILSDAQNERRVFNQVRTALRNGYSAEVVGLKTPDVPAQEVVSGIPISRLTLRHWQGGPLKFITFNAKLFRELLHRDFDILHAHDLWVLPGAIAAVKLRKKPIVYDAHEYYRGLEIFRRKKLSGFVWRVVELLTLRWVDAWIAINTHQAELYQQTFPFLTKPVVLMNLPELPDSGELPSVLSFSERKKEVIFQGILKPGRGLPRALEAMRWVQEGKLRIIGDGEIAGQLRELIRLKGLKDRVEMVGTLPWHELIAESNRALAGLVLFQATNLNYRYASPNKFFEYVMAGTPVIASDIPTFREFVQRYPVGVLVDPENPRDIAKAINRLLSNPKEWEFYHQQCLVARREWNWQKQESRLLALYRSFSHMPEKQL